MKKWPWFEREFHFDFPVEKLPDIIERLRGTPDRIIHLLGGVDSDSLAASPNDGTWSILGNVGHLFDLEPLWIGRLDDVLAQRKNLRDADLSNQATHEANHDQFALAEIVDRFRELRQQFVSQLEGLTRDQMGQSAKHPRLGTAMRSVDLAFFVAEHDDYHLARIKELVDTSTT